MVRTWYARPLLPPRNAVFAPVSTASLHRQQFSYKPLGSPTSDGVRAYGQDNMGLVLAVYLDTGAIAWKASCGPDAFAARYPSNVIVVDGVVYLGCSNLVRLR